MNSMHNEPEHRQPLQPFIYPRSINIFLLAIFCAIFIYLPYFLHSELPVYLGVIKQLKHAEQLFDDKKYNESLQIYMKILNKFKDFKDFKDGQIKIVRIFFALSERYDGLGYEDIADNIFAMSLNCLSSKKINKQTIKSLEKYVPTGRMDAFKQFLITKN